MVVEQVSEVAGDLVIGALCVRRWTLGLLWSQMRHWLSRWAAQFWIYWSLYRTLDDVSYKMLVAVKSKFEQQRRRVMGRNQLSFLGSSGDLVDGIFKREVAVEHDSEIVTVYDGRWRGVIDGGAECSQLGPDLKSCLSQMKRQSCSPKATRGSPALTSIRDYISQSNAL